MKKTICLLLALALMLSLCACGKAHSAAAPTAASESFYAVSDEGYYAYDMEEPAEYAVQANGLAVSGAPVAKRAGEDAPAENPEKIIYSADVTVETTEFEAAIAGLEELLASCGGWVESSSVNGSNFYNKSRGISATRSASYSLRIPSDRFQELMTSLSALGNVPYTHTYTENVTSQYYDTEAHLTAYQTQEARLLEMMEKAETVEDIVILEDRLTELRYRIESLQSTLKNWDRRVSYSTVDLELKEVREYTPEAENKLSYGQRLWRSLLDGLKGVAEFFEELLLWLVGALPALLILALLWLLLRKPVKKFFIKRREAAAERRAKKQSAKAEKANTKSE